MGVSLWTLADYWHSVHLFLDQSVEWEGAAVLLGFWIGALAELGLGAAVAEAPEGLQQEHTVSLVLPQGEYLELESLADSVLLGKVAEGLEEILKGCKAMHYLE